MLVGPGRRSGRRRRRGGAADPRGSPRRREWSYASRDDGGGAGGDLPRPGPGLGTDGTRTALGAIGSGIELQVRAEAEFKKPVDLAFPVPPEALAATGGKPEDAFFHVYRRVETASGAVFFQNLDWAKVECPGGASSCPDSEKKVVTSSFPWRG